MIFFPEKGHLLCNESQRRTGSKQTVRHSDFDRGSTAGSGNVDMSLEGEGGEIGNASITDGRGKPKPYISMMPTMHAETHRR